MSIFSGCKSKEDCLTTNTDIYIPTYRHITMTQNLNQVCPKFSWALVKWPKKTRSSTYDGWFKRFRIHNILNMYCPVFI